MRKDSEKFLKFVEELKEICNKHKVSISTSGYDSIQVHNNDIFEDMPIFLDNIEDMTNNNQRGK